MGSKFVRTIGLMVLLLAWERPARGAEIVDLVHVVRREPPGLTPLRVDRLQQHLLFDHPHVV